VVGGVVIAAALIRVFAVARGNPDVVRALLTYEDPGKVVIEAVYRILPPVFAFFAGFYWIIWFLIRFVRRPGFTVPLVLTALALIFSPWSQARIAIGLGLLLVVVGTLLERRRRKGTEQSTAQPSGSDSLSTAFLALIVVIWIAVLSTDDTPWVPTEQIVMNDGSVQVGYLVGASAGSIVVLYDADRSLVEVPEERIHSRQPCSVNQDNDPPLLALVEWQQARLPPCASGISQTCNDAFRFVVSPPDEYKDSVKTATFLACETAEEWIAGDASHGRILGQDDPARYLRLNCDAELLRETRVCQSLPPEDAASTQAPDGGSEEPSPQQ
jgi:hypothetical protein